MGHIRLRGGALLCLILAAVTSVDISPKAYQMLISHGKSAWISNVFYT